MNQSEIIENFFKNKFDKFNEELLNLRVQYDKEMSLPGCTNCRKRALRKKYTALINKIIEKNDNN